MLLLLCVVGAWMLVQAVYEGATNLKHPEAVKARHEQRMLEAKQDHEKWRARHDAREAQKARDHEAGRRRPRDAVSDRMTGWIDNLGQRAQRDTETRAAAASDGEPGFWRSVWDRTKDRARNRVRRMAQGVEDAAAGPAPVTAGDSTGPTAGSTGPAPQPAAADTAPTAGTPGPTAAPTGPTPGPSSGSTGPTPGPSSGSTGPTPGPSSGSTGPATGPTPTPGPTPASGSTGPADGTRINVGGQGDGTAHSPGGDTHFPPPPGASTFVVDGEGQAEQPRGPVRATAERIVRPALEGSGSRPTEPATDKPSEPIRATAERTDQRALPAGSIPPPPGAMQPAATGTPEIIDAEIVEDPPAGKPASAGPAAGPTPAIPAQRSESANSATVTVRGYLTNDTKEISVTQSIQLLDGNSIKPELGYEFTGSLVDVMKVAQQELQKSIAALEKAECNPKQVAEFKDVLAHLQGAMDKTATMRGNFANHMGAKKHVKDAGAGTKAGYLDD